MKSGHSFLSDFRGKVFSFASLNMMVAVDLSSVAFIMLRYILFIPNFLRTESPGAQMEVPPSESLFQHDSLPTDCNGLELSYKAISESTV